MTTNPTNRVGQIGYLDIVKFEGDFGSLGAVYDPKATFINMNFEGESPNGAFYIIRWETELDRKGAAPIMGSLALAEKDTTNYLLCAEKGSVKVPADLLEADAVKTEDCGGIRVEQQNQTLLWRLPKLSVYETSAMVATFLDSQSDLDRIAQFAQDTVKPEQRGYVTEHLPLFHQAYFEYAHLVIG